MTKRLLACLFALAATAVMSTQAEATAIGTSGYYLTYGLATQPGLTNFPFYDAFAWCQNPGFGTPPTGTGATWGINMSNSYPSITNIGYSAGDVPGTGTSAVAVTYTGDFVQTAYNYSGTYHSTFYPVASPAPSGVYSLEDAAESTTSPYHDAYINGTKVVTAMFEGYSQNSSMQAQLTQYQDAGASNPTTFPSFTYGATCSGLQTLASAWHNWEVGYGGGTNSPPSGEPNAHGTYTNNGSANYYSIYPN